MINVLRVKSKKKSTLEALTKAFPKGDAKLTKNNNIGIFLSDNLNYAFEQLQEQEYLLKDLKCYKELDLGVEVPANSGVVIPIILEPLISKFLSETEITLVVSVYIVD
jgi:hypothetical protein